MLKPLNNRVVVRPDKPEEVTSFGLILPKAGDEKPTTGIVTEGNDLVKVGERVFFSRYGYDEVTVGKETLYLVSNANLLAIFTD